MNKSPCINCVFNNPNHPPYYWDYGDENIVICSVKMRKMKEFKTIN
ncbi:MAG: hypothetical protein Q4P11_00055 [Methanobrevibacter sp.]|nr:hypothetical protein [Methanobrevibacter sp.]